MGTLSVQHLELQAGPGGRTGPMAGTGTERGGCRREEPFGYGSGILVENEKVEKG